LDRFPEGCPRSPQPDAPRTRRFRALFRAFTAVAGEAGRAAAAQRLPNACCRLAAAARPRWKPLTGFRRMGCSAAGGPPPPSKGPPMTTARKTAKPAAKPKNDAISLLIEDHKQVRALFKDYEKLQKDDAEDEQKQELAEQICALLTVHTMIEEEIFYPAVREVLEEQDLLDEAEVEHASAKDLISQIQEMEPDEDLYDAKVTVLGEYVEHHVKEEESEMFPKVKKAELDLNELGQQLLERKQELLAELGYAEEEQAS
jgi:hemerythrin superfamily protein